MITNPNGDELYHYYSGSVYSDELYHYGVPGMKWGQRRRQAKINKLQAKQQARVKSGLVTSERFRKTALKLNTLKAKQNLQKAKNNKDKVGKKVAKEALKKAKRTEDLRDVRGMNLSKKDRAALADVEATRARNREIDRIINGVVRAGRVYNMTESIQKSRHRNRNS